jgi:hypothetical protein
MNPMSHLDSFIDEGMEGLRSVLDARFFARSEVLFTDIADYATAAAAALVVAIAIVLAIAQHSAMEALVGIVLVIPIAACRYAGKKFLGSCRDLVEKNPSAIASPELTKVLGVITVILFAAVVCSGLFTALRSTLPEMWTFASAVNWIVMLIVGIVPGALALAYLSILYLNPGLISTGVSEAAPPGQTALSVVTIWIKSAVRLAPIMFGGVAAVGAVNLLGSLVYALDGGYAASLDGAETVIGGLLYPFAVYLMAIFFYIFVDVCRAILSHQKA